MLTLTATLPVTVDNRFGERSEKLDYGGGQPLWPLGVVLLSYYCYD